MIRKGQVRNIDGRDIRAQAAFVASCSRLPRRGKRDRRPISPFASSASVVATRPGKTSSHRSAGADVRWPTSNRNWWPASYWNAWPASSEIGTRGARAISRCNGSVMHPETPRGVWRRTSSTIPETGKIGRHSRGRRSAWPRLFRVVQLIRHRLAGAHPVFKSVINLKGNHLII